jgi:uncharacterized protein
MYNLPIIFAKSSVTRYFYVPLQNKIYFMQNICPVKIIEKYYHRETQLFDILFSHSNSVREKVLLIAETHKHLGLDVKFCEEAALLHDIGIFLTNAPSIQCFGTHHYIEHGYLGAELLRAEHLPKHALVCERHTGTGLALQDIILRNLPLPRRDMQPQTLEEQVICYADLFFSKTKLGVEKTVEKVRSQLEQWGQTSVDKFDEWEKIFGMQ